MIFLNTFLLNRISKEINKSKFAKLTESLDLKRFVQDFTKKYFHTNTVCISIKE